MKHLALGLLLTIVWVGTGCDVARARGGKHLKGSGRLIERTFETEPFVKLDVRSNAEVKLVAGSGAIVVEADDNVMEFVEVRTADGTLRISLYDPDGRIRSFADVTLKVAVPTDGRIEKIAASGASKVEAEPLLTASEIELRAAGASHIAARVACRKCDIEAAGASRATVDGTADRCEAEATGASRLALALQCTDCEIECSGASRADASGTARSCTIEASGASSVHGENLVATHCHAEATGASSVRIQCTGTLQAQASGASKIIYSGTCTVTEVRTSGASSVRRK